MDRYQQQFGESFDKTNLRHIAERIISVGQRLLEASDHSLDMEKWDLYWEMSGRFGSVSSDLRALALLVDKRADAFARREVEGLTQQPLPLPSVALLGHAADLDDLGGVVMPRELAMPLVGSSRSISGFLGGSTRSSSSSSSSSSRPLPPRGPRKRTRRAHMTS